MGKASGQWLVPLFALTFPLVWPAWRSASAPGAREDVGMVKALAAKGARAFNAGNPKRALQDWLMALRIVRSIPDEELLKADCYGKVGVALLRMGRYEEGMPYQEKAIQILAGVKGTEAMREGIARNIARARRLLSNRGGRLTEPERRNQRRRANTLMDQAWRAQSAGDAQAAIKAWCGALRILETIPGSGEQQASCFLNIGAGLSDLGRYEKAQMAYTLALASYRESGGGEEPVADCHLNMGYALYRTGRAEEAIVRYNMALRIYEGLAGGALKQAHCYGNIGLALTTVGMCDLAIAKLKHALRLYDAAGGTNEDRAKCHVNVGLALGKQGEFDQALARYRHALAKLQAQDDTKQLQAACYLDIALTQNDMGEFGQAIANCKRALSLLGRDESAKLYRAPCHIGVGDARLSLGRFTEAIDAYERASRERVEAPEVSWGLARAHRRGGQPGDRLDALGRYLEAIRFAEEERSLFLAFEHRAAVFERMSALFADFVTYLAELGEKGIIPEGLDIRRWAADTSSPKAGWEAAFHFADRGKGRALHDLMREKSASEAASVHSVALDDRRALSSEISRRTARRGQLSLADVQLKARLSAEIQDLMHERNILEAQRRKPQRPGFPPATFRRPAEMAADLSQHTAVLQYAAADDQAWVLILTRDGVSAYCLGVKTQALPDRLSRREPTLAKLVDAWKTRPGSVGLDGLVRLARERPEDMGRKARQRLIDAEQEQRILARLGEIVLPDEALRELRQREIQHLLVVPDGSLNYMPFAMLRVKGDPDAADPHLAAAHYVVQEFATSYVPAMAVLDMIRKQKQERQKKRQRERRWLLAFANPDYGVDALPVTDEMSTRLRNIRCDYYRGGGFRLPPLPESEIEAEQIASLFGDARKHVEPTARDPHGQVIVYARSGACEGQVKRLLVPDSIARDRPYWRYVLFSTHGFADPQNGMLSCIALSSESTDSEQDGFLLAQEVLDMELDTDVVVLSACRTGLGRMRAGEGLIGLSTAFFYAGSESVCASLWSVPSAPTRELVTEFFRHLRDGSTDKAVALQRAQLGVMRSSKAYGEPWSWAGFVLSGEHRSE